MGDRPLHEPFHQAERQEEADRLGMLVFLGSEAMLFGGIFAVAMALRLLHPGEYVTASSQMKLWHGTLNTAVLLTSSLLAALAVEAARGGQPRSAGRALWGAVALGLVFLGIKGHEYWLEYQEGVIPGLSNARFGSAFEQLFMNLYFAATGLHALHLIGGMVLLAIAASKRSAREDRQAVLIGNVALYWHLVDLVWVFLYPTLYLAGAGR